MEVTNKQRLKNFLYTYKIDDTCVDDKCNTGYNDLSFSYGKKLAVIHDVLRGRFHSKKKADTETGETDSFIPTNYNQVYAYYRTYHQLGDIDMKNISLYAMNTESIFRKSLLEGSVKQHLLTIKYHEFIDEFSRITAGYGNCIVRIEAGRPYVVNLRNFYYDNNAGSLQETSSIERFKLEYYEAIKKYPEHKEKLDELYAKISVDGYVYIHFVYFNSWFSFGNNVRKGVNTYIDCSPELYDSPALNAYIIQMQEDNQVYENLHEVDLTECKDWLYDSEGNKTEQLFPYVISKAFPVDGEIKAQGVVELLIPLAARFNQLMERLDRLVNSSLSGTKIHEFEIGFESDYTEDDLRNMRPDEILTMVKDKQNIRSVVDNAVTQEAVAILQLINFIKNMMNEITGVTQFAMSGDINQSAKATTASSIVSASQTPFKKFVESMAHAHMEIIGDFILPYLLNNKKGEIVFNTASKSIKQQVILEAATNEVNRNWESYSKKLWNKTKEMSKVNPSVAPRVGFEEDYQAEIEKLVLKYSNKPVKFVLGEWAKKIGASIVVDVDNEYADKDRKFNKLIQLATVPMVQQIIKAEEIAMELLRNSDVDNYDFIKTKAESLEDMKEQQDQEVYKNVLAQQFASTQGGYGKTGGRPEDEMTNRVQAHVQGAQPVRTQI